MNNNNEYLVGVVATALWNVDSSLTRDTAVNKAREILSFKVSDAELATIRARAALADAMADSLRAVDNLRGLEKRDELWLQRYDAIGKQEGQDGNS